MEDGCRIPYRSPLGDIGPYKGHVEAILEGCRMSSVGCSASSSSSSRRRSGGSSSSSSGSA